MIVGSRIVPQTPLPAAWLAAGHAQPAAGGYYTGTSDRTYTFTAADSGSVGTGTLRLNWSDGAGGSGTLNFGAGYKSPTLLDVSHGVKLGLLSGTLNAGESFTVAANTPATPSSTPSRRATRATSRRPSCSSPTTIRRATTASSSRRLR